MDTKTQAKFYYHRQDFDKSIELFNQALIEDIQDADCYWYLAIIHAGKREYKTAKQYSEHSIALDPTFGAYHVTYGAILGALGQNREAMQEYVLATQLSPGCPTAHWNLSLEQLKYPGLWNQGWANYQYRKLHTPVNYYRSFLPEPPKEDPKGTLLIHAEQGLGDVMFGLRFLEGYKQRFRRVYLECHHTLVNLLQGHPYVDRVFARPLDNAFPYHGVDYNMPLMDVIYNDNIDYGRLANYDDQYLWPDENIVSAFKEQLPEGKTIGVVWNGNRNHPNDCNRSMPSEMLEPLKELGTLISLSEETPAIDMLNGKDFISDAKYTLAMCKAVDYVVSVDTFVANLCGAAKIPCFVLHPQVKEWRWYHNPFIYPSCESFTQAVNGDWESLIAQVKERIKDEIV